MDETEGDAPAFCLYFCAAPEGSRRAFSVEVGREALGSYLTRADTPHREPEVLVAVVGTQSTTVVAQAVLAAATVRGSRPPEADGAGIVERAIEVVATIDRRESGDVASNAVLFIVGR